MHLDVYVDVYLLMQVFNQILQMFRYFRYLDMQILIQILVQSFRYIGIYLDTYDIHGDMYIYTIQMFIFICMFNSQCMVDNCFWTFFSQLLSDIQYLGCICIVWVPNDKNTDYAQFLVLKTLKEQTNIFFLFLGARCFIHGKVVISCHTRMPPS